MVVFKHRVHPSEDPGLSPLSLQVLGLPVGPAVDAAAENPGRRGDAVGRGRGHHAHGPHGRPLVQAAEGQRRAHDAVARGRRAQVAAAGAGHGAVGRRGGGGLLGGRNPRSTWK